MDKTMEWVKCNLCGSEDFSLLFKGRDYRYFSPLTFKVMKCNGCGLICLNPRPQQMIDYYPKPKKGTVKDHFLFLKTNRVKIIKKLKKSGRILDIGCGEGYFLFDIHKEGWEVYGNDISKIDCDFARRKLGLKNIYDDDLLSLDFPRDFFDIVTMWHTLEGMKKPQETLRRINQILKDDGVLIIESPDFSSLQRKFFRKKWYGINLPRHLYQFTPKTLGKLLKSAGFRVYRRDYIVNPRISFMCLKMSLLRWLGIHCIPHKEEIKEAPAVTNFRQAKIPWRLARFVFDFSCFLLSSFLILIDSDACFRLYGRKINKK